MLLVEQDVVLFLQLGDPGLDGSRCFANTRVIQRRRGAQERRIVRHDQSTWNSTNYLRVTKSKGVCDDEQGGVDKIG